MQRVLVRAKRVYRQVALSTRKSLNLLFRPAAKPSNKKTLTQGSRSRSTNQTWWEFFRNASWAKFEGWLFPNMPEHYPLHKKLYQAKAGSMIGKMWDVLLIFMSILACAIYVSETYLATYEAVHIYSIIEMVVTQFFAADFLYNFMSAANTLQYMTEGWTIVDLITIIPVYITLWLRSTGSEGHGVNLSVFRFVRILRLMRIMRMFKLLNGLSGVQRQLVTLTLTLVSLVFMAAGIIHIMENDLKQLMEYKCNYIGPGTNWLPSCDASFPFDYSIGTCDCVGPKYKCKAVYDAADRNGEPSGIACMTMTFLDAFYFLVVTVSTVGYGDISPTTQASRAVVVLFIMTSVVLIPVQVNELSVLLAASSAYRQPYKQGAGESHIIVCGYISDFRKLEKFFKEFFHPDRNYSAAPDFHAVILSPVDPSSDVQAMLYCPHFDGRITYIIGSSLATEDLIKARADSASAMFFLCNAETPEENAKLDDAATVLRTLSVTNFNPHLECFVQVLKPEDRDILKDSEVDVVLCLDEYKTCIQARNAICPGISTLIENIFHTFSLPTQLLDTKANSAIPFTSWTEEYGHGLAMEPYYIPLIPRYCEMLAYEWTLMVEGIYLEWDVMCIGVASSQDHSLLLNPGAKEMKKFQYNSRFFKKYNMLILLCSEQSKASSIASGLDDPVVIDRILNKILIAEETFTVRRHTDKRKDVRNKKEQQGSVLTSLRDIIRVTKSWSASKAFAQVGPQVDSDEEDFTGYVAKATGMNAQNAAKVAKLNILKHHAQQVKGNDENDEENEESSDDEGDGFSSPLKLNPKVSEAKEKMRRMTSFQQGRTPANGLSGPGGHNEAKSGLPGAPPVLVAGQQGSGLMEAEVASVAAGGEAVAAVLSTTDALMGPDDNIEGMIDDANHLKGHIIIFGCTTNLFLFLTELRRDIHATGPSTESPPAVIVVDDVPPRAWPFIREAFADVFYIRGKITRSVDFNRTNIINARSVALLAGRDNVTKVEEEMLDAEALFAYLKLEKYIPKEVFFTVELTCVSNMAVLNSTVVRRFRMAQATALMQAKAAMEEGDRQTKLNLQEKEKAKASNALEEEETTKKETPEERAIRKFKKRESKRAALLARANSDSKPMSEMSKGTFSSHKAVMKPEYYEHLSRGILNVIANVPARRISSVEAKDGAKGGLLKKESTAEKIDLFWTTQDSHQMLSVFASGNAFVPATFDSILAQSFYSAFTPLLCERLVCGSKHQSIFQVNVPQGFINRYFVDLYRACMSRSLSVLALYRAPVAEDGALLPFVLTSPSADTLLRSGDRMFVIGNPAVCKENLSLLNADLVEYPDGSMSLADTLGIQMGVSAATKPSTYEESKSATGNKPTKDKEATTTGHYKYLPLVNDPRNSSPLKEHVTQVFFEGTSVPL